MRVTADEVLERLGLLLGPEDRGAATLEGHAIEVKRLKEQPNYLSYVNYFICFSVLGLILTIAKQIVYYERKHFI